MVLTQGLALSAGGVFFFFAAFLAVKACTSRDVQVTEADGMKVWASIARLGFQACGLGLVFDFEVEAWNLALWRWGFAEEASASLVVAQDRRLFAARSLHRRLGRR